MTALAPLDAGRAEIYYCVHCRDRFTSEAYWAHACGARSQARRAQAAAPEPDPAPRTSLAPAQHFDPRPATRVAVPGPVLPHRGFLSTEERAFRRRHGLSRLAAEYEPAVPAMSTFQSAAKVRREARRARGWGHSAPDDALWNRRQGWECEVL